MATTRTDFGTFPDTATSVDFRAMTGTRLSPYRVAMSGACIAFNHPPTAPWGVHGGRTRVAGYLGCGPPPNARLRAHTAVPIGAAWDCGSCGPSVGAIRQVPSNQSARDAPVSASARAPDRQAPPPSRLLLQWPAGAILRRKSPTKHPRAIIGSENFQKNSTLDLDR